MKIIIKYMFSCLFFVSSAQAILKEITYYSPSSQCVFYYYIDVDSNTTWSNIEKNFSQLFLREDVNNKENLKDEIYLLGTCKGIFCHILPDDKILNFSFLKLYYIENDDFHFFSESNFKKHRELLSITFKYNQKKLQLDLNKIDTWGSVKQRVADAFGLQSDEIRAIYKDDDILEYVFWYDEEPLSSITSDTIMIQKDKDCG